MGPDALKGKAYVFYHVASPSLLKIRLRGGAGVLAVAGGGFPVLGVGLYNVLARGSALLREEHSPAACYSDVEPESSAMGGSPVPSTTTRTPSFTSVP